MLRDVTQTAAAPGASSPRQRRRRRPSSPDALTRDALSHASELFSPPFASWRSLRARGPLPICFVRLRCRNRRRSARCSPPTCRSRAVSHSRECYPLRLAETAANPSPSSSKSRNRRPISSCRPLRRQPPSRSSGVDLSWSRVTCSPSRYSLAPTSRISSHPSSCTIPPHARLLLPCATRGYATSACFCTSAPASTPCREKIHTHTTTRSSYIASVS